MTLTALQIILIIFWDIVMTLDGITYGFLGDERVMIGCLVTGLIVGNPTYGLVVAGTLLLTQLGVKSYGGASVPNITTSGMITTALGASQVPAGASLAEISDSAITLAASIGVALASLFIELNVLTRFANTYFQHRADKYVQEGNEKKIVQMNVLGAIPWVLASALPLSLFLIFGQGLVAAIESAIPTWLMEGFRIAGSMLPVVGFAILMRYLPVAKEPQWLLVGFILAAYYHTPIIGISLVGLVIAYLVYRHSMNKAQTAGAVEVEEDEDE